MAFPGDRAIKQFPRGARATFDSAILAVGEICILQDTLTIDWEIRVGDGVTPGGMAFVNKEYVDVVAGNDGVLAGTDIIAATGTDLEQRSWPATSWAIKAPINSPDFTGAPKADTPTVGDSTRRLATTEFVDTGYKRLGYMGTNADETIFPIGHLLVANGNGHPSVRNAVPSATLRLDGTQSYMVGGSGTVVAGTWRQRGRIADSPSGGYSYLFERVA